MTAFTNTPLALADLPRHSTVPLLPVALAYKKIMITEQIIYWLFISAGLFAMGKWVPLLQPNYWRAGLAVLAVLLLAILLYTAGKAHANMGYALREHDLIFRKGWLFEQLHVVPLKKIQHCQVKRGPMERRYNLASVKIFTAGGAGADVVLAGLPIDTANRLKDWLIGATPEKLTDPLIADTHDTPLV